MCASSKVPDVLSLKPVIKYYDLSYQNIRNIFTIKTVNVIVTYPSGHHPRFYFRHMKLVILASLSSTLIFSYIIGIHFFEYKQTNIDPVGPAVIRYVEQTDGSHTITYVTTGPTFSSFHMDCPPRGPYPDFGPYYNCVRLEYNGKAGIVELSVPARLLSELPWIDRVEIFPGFGTVGVPFELVSQDKFARWYRIDIPAGYYNINLIGGTKSEFPYSFLIALGVFGLLLFMLSWFLLWLIIEKISKLFTVISNVVKFRK